ncbi:MAG: hypothetical protein F4Z37_11070 [Rhodothermaceae bacterium]|nr:hypothetical protein [Rhodothermaceae bacterium]
MSTYDKHMPPPNFRSKTIWTGDNLHIMRGIDSETIDLIYLDPPFNSKANYAAPIGSTAAGAAFKDTWSLDDLDLEWIRKIQFREPALHRVINAAMTDSDKSYLVYMAIRLLEMKRILRSTGSIYLHCDPTMSHYLKLVMDAIFGRKNFRNEIAWHYGGRGAKAISKQFARNKDVILYYSVNDSNQTFNKQRIPYRYSVEEARKRGFRKDENGKWFKTSPRGDYTDKSIERLRKEGRIYETRTGNIRIKYFLDQDDHGIIEYKLAGDTWFDIPDAMHMSKKERTGYPTQKPLALLNRIIEASTNRGDVVFDPFCGCATTCVAADALGREWIGIDISEKAYELVNVRLRKSQGAQFYEDGSKQSSFLEEVKHRKDIPQRTDLGKIPRYNCIENKRKLFGDQEGKCNWCNVEFSIQNLEVDHIVAKSKGGTDHIDNLQLLCSHCNRVKGDRGMEYMMKLRSHLRLAA